ncbi:hypothetical protein GGF44_004193, partial [Coemansia sp. RSA 1694]
MRLSTLIPLVPLIVLAFANNVPVTSSAIDPAQNAPHFATSAPAAVANLHDSVHVPAGAAVPHALSPGPSPQEDRHEQALEQTLNNAVALPAPGTDSAGEKSQMKQMMLFFPDPAVKMTPEQQQEWAHKFNQFVSEMTPEQRESWMHE